MMCISTRDLSGSANLIISTAEPSYVRMAIIMLTLRKKQESHSVFLSLILNILANEKIGLNQTSNLFKRIDRIILTSDLVANTNQVETILM